MFVAQMLQANVAGLNKHGEPVTTLLAVAEETSFGKRLWMPNKDKPTLTLKSVSHRSVTMFAKPMFTDARVMI